MKHIPILTLSGASGSGKTTLMEELIARFPERFTVFQSVTTRAKRPSDKEGSFVYLALDEFERWEKDGRFAWTVDITGHRYGTTKETIETAMRDSRTAVSPIAPNIVKRLRDLVGEENVVSLYILSLPHDLVLERLRARGDSEEAIEERIKNDRLWDDEARASGIPYHFLENTGTVDELVARAVAVLDQAEAQG